MMMMMMTLRSLVASGQLEFVNGGYVMSDEATASFVDMVNQQTLGAQFISREFPEVLFIFFWMMMMMVLFMMIVVFVTFTFGNWF